MNRRLQAAFPAHKLFKIDASNCNLRVGDHVIAETTVGRDFRSGGALKAGCRGVVEAVNWSADDHALFVWVRVSPLVAESQDRC
jgi:hypothetical protein